jgi:uncharacterized membrane protein YgcG
MVAIARMIRTATLAAATVGVGQGAAAQDTTPIPEYTGDRVYVKGVPDRYEQVARTIKDLERRSPQSYFVVVVKSAGAGEHATRDYLDRLYDSWRRDAEAKGLKLDPDRSVIVAAALDNRQVSVHAGTLLRDRFGLTKEAIDGEIVRRAFIPLAREGDYPGALGSLLTSIHDFIASHGDAETKAAALQPVAPRQAESVAATAAPAPVAATPNRNPIASTAKAPAVAAPSTTGRDLAWSLIGSLVAIGLMVLGLVWLGRRRARGSFHSKLKEYRSKAVDMMDRLDALKARLKTLTTEDPDYKEPVTGKTLAHFQKVQDDLGKLWDRWLEVMDVVDKAQKRGGRGGKDLAEADKLVSDAKVFDEVEAGAKACGAAMDQLNAAHEEAREAAAKVVDARSQALAGVEDVGKAGLPTAPYQPDADRIAALERQAGQALTPDPLGAKETLDEALGLATKLRGRAANILARLDDGKQVRGALDTLRADVAEKRREGLRLVEEGGDPDHPIARADQAVASLQEALEAGDADAAGSRLEAARRLANEAQGTLDSVLQARARCEREQPERERETRRLREALGQYAAFEQELKRDFDPGSWQAVAGNLAQARALLETFGRKAEEAAQAADRSTQKYLLGARLIGQLAQEQNAVFRLMNAVGERLSALKALRDESRRLASDLEDRDREAGRFFSQYDHVIGAQARASLKEAEEAGKQVARKSSAAKPDWPTIRQLLARALEEYSIARSQAEADLKIYEVLTSEYDEVRRYADQVQSFLAGHSEDRLAANQRYRNAEAILKRIGDESTRVGNEWPRLLDQVRGARADLDQSERLAREDVRLARQAESEISDASRAIREARGYFQMGVTLNTSGAESLLSQAQQLYHGQDYEQAVRTAAAAVQQVRQAHNLAVQQSYLREMQLHAEQRRRAVGFGDIGMGAATGAAAAMLGQAASASPSPAVPNLAARGPEPPGDGGSDSSSTSWSSETSESSW